LPAGEPRRLTTQDEEAAGGLVWVPDNRRIVFASTRGLWSIGLNRGLSQPVPVPGYNPALPAISMKGDRLAFTQISEDLDIWSAEGPELSRARAGTAPLRPTKLISSTTRDTNPQYSPDGNHIAFTSSRSGTTQIWVCDTDGSNPVQITNFEDAASPRWSPDGRYIAFDSPAEGRFGIYVIPAQGGSVRRITSNRSQNSMPSWSWDGKWIYFASDRTGDSQIWKVPFAGGAAAQVTHYGGADAFESRDGKFVYYAKMAQPGIWRVSTQGGAEALVVAQASHFHWSLFDKGVCWIEQGLMSQPAIHCLDFRNNHANTVSKLPANIHVNEWGPSVSVSPDGHSVLFVASDRRESDIMLIENFQLPN
jgi:Tol biopolymer transport system component